MNRDLYILIGLFIIMTIFGAYLEQDHARRAPNIWPLYMLGNAHYRAGSDDIAMQYWQQGIDYNKTHGTDYKVFNEAGELTKIFGHPYADCSRNLQAVKNKEYYGKYLDLCRSFRSN